MHAVLPFVGQLALFLLCGFAPLGLALTGQVAPAALGALLGGALWLRVGPPPLPGLLPGFLMTCVLLNNVLTLGLLVWPVT